MDESKPGRSAESVDRVLADFLERRARGETPELEELCAEHPTLESELRRLGPILQALASEPSLGVGGRLDSVVARLEREFDEDIDPGIDLEPSPEALLGESETELLSRLSSKETREGRYRLLGEIARGGMGAILEVRDRDLRRRLAMKVILDRSVRITKGQTPASGSRALARFLEEAQLTGQLDHPGIVPVHELGLDPEGRVYFTMKLVKGKTLKRVFDELARGEGDWTQTRVLGLILKVCEAMSYAHDRGVIHRDLKPANVMIGRYGEVYVMDWGLAKILGRDDTRDIRLSPPLSVTLSEIQSDRADRASNAPDSPLCTMDGDVVGTPAYMPPEQAAGRIEDMGPHSDVYALGAMLYHLLSGHMPYVAPEMRIHNYAVWHRVQEGPPAPLLDEAKDAPSELVAICEKAMARETGERYRNTTELAQDLSAYVEGRVVRAHAVGAWTEARKWVKRNKPLAASLAAAVVATLVGGAAFALKAQEATRAAGEAREASRRADDKASEAQRAREYAEAETAKVLRLSDSKRLQELEAAADELWPPLPDAVAALEDWLSRSRDLTSNLPAHRAVLHAMRAESLPWTREQQAHDSETHPQAPELHEMREEFEGLIAQVEGGLEGDAWLQAERRIVEFEPALQSMADAVESRRTWRFETAQDQWQHDVLTELVQGLEGLQTGLAGDDSTSEQHGWSVPKRLRFSRMLDQQRVEGAAHSRAWSEALPAIRAAYPGLELEPQSGLLPLSPDPSSGLWEFAHLMTGDRAVRADNGKLILTETAGVVLVLIPGGSFRMGAQSVNARSPNYSPQAANDEAPVHTVRMSPFFLSKFELTQSQWMILTGTNLSYTATRRWGSDWLASGAGPSLLHPVEQVTWIDCRSWLTRAGLEFPSEAQWEYATRGGTDTLWWTGPDKESLGGAANLEDSFARGNRTRRPALVFEMWLDDGATMSAPVGSYAANPFGLHDVAGNVWEWCLDEYDSRTYRRRLALDPVVPWRGSNNLIIRGGSFSNRADRARSAYRTSVPWTYANFDVGLRPARAIEP